MKSKQLATSSLKNVRLVPVEPKVKSAKTCNLSLCGVRPEAETAKSADPHCYAVSSSMEDDMNYADHIARICKIEDITVDSHSSGGRAYRRKRLIKIRPVKSAITYAVALHEIGHILGPRQNGARLDKEVGAWEWAMAHAIEWTDAMSAKRAACLQSYLRWSERSRQAKRAADDHPIHAML